MPDVTFGAVSLQLRALTQAGLLRARAEWPESPVSGPEGGPRSGGKDARADVGRRALAPQAARGARTDASRPARAQANRSSTQTMRKPMPTLAHRLDRTIVINAPREAVFRYFTDSARWATWWGAGSTIDSRPGGRIYIRYPEGTEVAGEVIEVRPPERIVFTYGYVSGSPIPAGKLARDHPARHRWRRDAPGADARVRERRGPRPARAGLALSALDLLERRGGRRQQRRGRHGRRMVRFVGGTRRGPS